MGEKLDWSSPRDDSDQHDDYGNDKRAQSRRETGSNYDMIGKELRYEKMG